MMQTKQRTGPSGASTAGSVLRRGNARQEDSRLSDAIASIQILSYFGSLCKQEQHNDFLRFNADYNHISFPSAISV
jgi:hypothetical protein